jgi:hypothetical protein
VVIGFGAFEDRENAEGFGVGCFGRDQMFGIGE